MKNSKKWTNLIILTLALVIGLIGCAVNVGGGNQTKGQRSGQKDGFNGIYVYYLNSTNTSLVPFEYNKTADETTVGELLGVLNNVPSGEGYVAPLSGITVLSTSLDENGKLSLELGRQYETLNGTKELLTRAAIVRTLVNNPDINTVEFIVGGAPIVDSNSMPIGAMGRNTFVDYFGKEQDSLLSENVTIYFASSDGSGLYRETHRIYYENTLSLEQAVIKAMLDEPENNNARVAISPNINIINITTTDGTCYLDMNSNFFDVNSNITQSLAIKAIVNSLCEIKEVRQVQINIINSTEELNSQTHLETVSGMYTMDVADVLN